MNQVSAYKFFIEKIKGASGTPSPPPKQKQKQYCKHIYEQQENFIYPNLRGKNLYCSCISNILRHLTL